MQMKLKLKEIKKRVDHFERAKRLEEIPLLTKQYEEFVVADKEFWDQVQDEKIKIAIREREKAVEMKNRLLRTLDDRKTFLEKLAESCKKAIEAKNEKFQEELNNIRKERLNNRRLDRIISEKERSNNRERRSRRNVKQKKRDNEKNEKKKRGSLEKRRKEKRQRKRKGKQNWME